MIMKLKGTNQKVIKVVGCKIRPKSISLKITMDMPTNAPKKDKPY